MRLLSFRRRVAVAPVTRAVAAAVFTGVAITAVLAVEGSPVGASSSSGLRKVACRPSASDLQLQAPTYAQDLGAGGEPDGWWCQLPHATQMPAGFKQAVRSVSPLANDYGLYSTQYGKHVNPPGSAEATRGPNITVSDNVESVQFPGKLDYGTQPKGKKVRLAKGVTGIVTSAGGTVSVTWRYPTHGVPKYLKAVATVNVTATGVPESVVLAVAKHVEPD
jgi:hypothetical protein